MVIIVALSMVSALASESAAAAESTKMLEGLLERMEEQDRKIVVLNEKNIELNEKIARQDEKMMEQDEKNVELTEKMIFKMARQDANHKEALAAQQKEIAALRERNAEHEAQIATLRRERLQARDNNNDHDHDHNDNNDDFTDDYATAQQKRRRTLSASPPERAPNKVILRAEGDTFNVVGDLTVHGKIVAHDGVHGTFPPPPTPAPTLSQAPTPGPRRIRTVPRWPLDASSSLKQPFSFADNTTASLTSVSRDSRPR